MKDIRGSTIGASYGDIGTVKECYFDDGGMRGPHPRRGLPGTLVMLVALIGLLVPCVVAASGATAVVAGERHTCAVTTGGAMWCWGWNIYGGLGDGTTTDRPTPVMVSGLTSGVVAAAAGPYHTCAVTSGGALLCWGGNQYGQLGDGTTTNRLTPVPVSGLTSGVVAVTAGYYHTCALTSGGAVQCWGANFSGRLGDGTTTNRLTPVAVSGLTSGVVAVAAGAHHTCAVTSGGALQCWGGNLYGQLGDGTTTDRLTPVAVSGLMSGVVAVAANLFHSCAVTSGGAVQCWGNNANGQLGDGTTTNRFVPGPVSGLGSGIAAVTAGEAHTCALTSTGGVLCWGGNFAGQVGDGTTTDRVTATPVTGLQSGVRAITAGQWHTCALTIAGAVTCWGYNGSGGLGDGTTTDRYTPGTASGFEGAAAPIVATASLPAGTGGVAYSQVLSATSGATPYTWTVASGALPAGLTLSPQGLLSGEPLIAGTYDFRIRVTGADGASSERDLSLTVDLFRRYFAEGASSGFFDCYFALANPSSTTTANVTLSFLRYDSQTFVHTVQVPPLTRRTVNVKSISGMELALGFSTILESNVGVVADRTMSWDATGYGSHAETSIKEPAQTWYLAEGATQNGFQLYYLIENPNPVPVDVTVTYLRRSPNPPFDIVYSGIPAYTRKTIYVNGEDPRLSSGDVSGIITSLTQGGPIIVERAMYLDNENRQFNAGHDSAGVTAPAADWFLAEGATVRTFDMFILLANPGDTSGTATITYMLTDGRTLVKSYPVEARSRQTVWVNGERDDADPTFNLSRASLSAMVHSTVPIIVERAMWWSAVPAGPWVEAHDAVGTTETGTMWAVADGEQGGSRSTDTYVLVANTSSFPGRVRVTLMGEDGSTPSTERDVPANSRTTFWMGGTAVTADSPFGNTLAGKKFGAIVESLPMAQGVAAIVVERAMYSNANGVVWAAGTDVVATKLK